MTDIHQDGGSNPGNRPCVSVVMPVRNEGRFIEATLRSLQAQQTPDFRLEILVVDGMSEDDTPQKVARLARQDGRIKVISNPSRYTPSALNLGIRAAAGEYVCIMGAHASYDPDYIAVCLRELIEHDAVACSGRIVTAPADSMLQARLVAWALAHPFASSSRSVRTQKEGFVDTVPFPVMRKQALLDAGGYNEQLLRNQDNDMNQRLRAMGFKLYLTAKTQCRYYPRARVWDFLKHAFSSGLWNARSLKRTPDSLSLRHLAPFAFVSLLLALVFLVTMGLALPALRVDIVAWALGAILASHLAFGTVAGIHISMRERTLAGLWLAPLIFAFHFAYGLGTLQGLMFPDRAFASVVNESSKDSISCTSSETTTI